LRLRGGDDLNDDAACSERSRGSSATADRSAKPRAVRLRYSIIAGLATGTLVTIVLIPLYLKLIGIEAVGLIGFYNAILALLLVVDHAFGVFVMREIARLSGDRGDGNRAHSLVVTAEVIYFAIGFVVAIAVTAGASLIVGSWLLSRALDERTVVVCLVLGAWTLPFQLLVNVHVNIMIGLERQIEANVLLVVLGVCRGLLALFAILVISPVTESYFGAQLAAVVLSAMFSAAIIRRRLETKFVWPGLNLRSFTQAWRLNALLLANAVSFVAVTQSDKMLISALLPLSALGYYILASTLSGLPGLAVGPIMMALLPRFSRLIESHEISETCRLFHLASQAVSVLLLPVWAVTMIFPGAFVEIWTGDPGSTTEAIVVLPLLMSGTVLLAFNCVPNSVMLAGGMPQFPLYANLAAILALPIAYFLILRYGAAGATSTWLILGLMNVTLAPYLMHRKILRNEQARWYAIDIGLPLLATLILGLAAHFSVSSTGGRVVLAIKIVLVWGAMSTGAAIAAPDLRREIIKLTKSTYRRIIS
jgi:O-antigen/teichoic acid export membrane protein